MKLCIVVALILATLAVTYGKSHNVNWGTRSLRDVLLKHEVVYAKSRLLSKKSQSYEFNQKNAWKPKTITQVLVTDQYANDKGGYATLTSGGPGSTFVKLRFTSQRSHGYNFIVDIYGV